LFIDVIKFIKVVVKFVTSSADLEDVPTLPVGLDFFALRVRY